MATRAVQSVFVEFIFDHGTLITLICVVIWGLNPVY